MSDLSPVVWLSGPVESLIDVDVANYHITQFPDRDTQYKNLTFAMKKATWDNLTSKKQEKIKKEIGKCLAGTSKLNQSRVNAILASLPKEPETQLELTTDGEAFLRSIGLRPPPSEDI